MTEDPLVICLLPSVFNPKSNGHYIYLDFCASLIGEFKNLIFISNDSRYAHGELGRQSYVRYRERFAGYYITEQDFAILLTPELTQKLWLILPDHIEGLDSILVHFLRNDPHVAGCINVMLAPAYSLASQSKNSLLQESHIYKKDRDYFVFYMSAYSNFICKEELYIEPLPSGITPIAGKSIERTIKKAEDRKLISFYLGKGIVNYSKDVRTLLEELKDMGANIEPVLITRTWPPTKKEYNEVIRNSLCLITYDPITNVERDALIQGTPVLDVNPIMSKTWLPSADAAGLLTHIRQNQFEEISERYMDFSRACLKANKVNCLLFASIVSGLINHGDANPDYISAYTDELEHGFQSLNNKLNTRFANLQQLQSQALLSIDDVISIATTPC